MKFVTLAASVVILTCLGGLYAWSSFVAPLKTTYELTTAQTQIIFGGLIGCFTIAMTFAGGLLERHGARKVIAAGGVIFGLGYLMASFGGGSFATLFLGISVLGGVGTGFAYVAPIVTCIKCFPSHKGLVTGITTAAFGGGAILLANVANALTTQSVDVLTIFRWMGLAYFIVVPVAALAIPSERLKRGQTGQRRLLLSDPVFWGMAIGMFSGTFAGLLVIGNLQPMATSKGVALGAAAACVSAFAAGNAFGRLAWGWLSDKIGPWSIPLSLAFLVVALGVLAMAASAAAYIAVSAMLGIGFGACFVVYVARVAARYGYDKVSMVYPLVFLSYGVSGITGPLVGGALYDATSSYSPAVLASLALVTVGFFTSTFLLRSRPIAATAEAAI